MPKLVLVILLFFSIETYAKENKVLSIVSFTGKKILITDSITQQKTRMKNKVIKLPIPVKKVLSGGKYLINLNGKDTIISKIYVNTDKVIPVIECPLINVAVKNTASTRGLGNQCP
jgi:hypothetical protein